MVDDDGAKSQHELFDDDAHRDTFKINTNLAVSAAVVHVGEEGSWVPRRAR